MDFYLSIWGWASQFSSLLVFFFEVAVLRRGSGVDHSKFGVEVADIVAVKLGNAVVFTLLGQ